jgi:hypothetical protein
MKLTRANAVLTACTIIVLAFSAPIAFAQSAAQKIDVIAAWPRRQPLLHNVIMHGEAAKLLGLAHVRALPYPRCRLVIKLVSTSISVFYRAHPTF